MEEKEFETPVTGGDATPPQKGRRLDPAHKSGKGKVVLIVVGIVVAVLAAAYLGLCAYAAGERILPGTKVGAVDVGGMNAQGAAQALETAVRSRYDALELPIQVGEHTVTLEAKEAQVTVDVDAAVANAQKAGKENFLVGGWNLLAGLCGGEWEVECPVAVGDQAYVEKILTQVAKSVDQPVVETVWEIDEDEETAALVLTKGVTGQSVVMDTVRAQLDAALQSGASDPITAPVTATAPQAVDFDDLAAQVDREPIDATLDIETDEVIPHRLGLELDAAKAQALYDSLAEGESGAVELEITQPDVTTLELRSTLFRDILGEGSSKITGDAARINNVHLAAKACDGVILLPGQKMSYNQTTGQRTTAKGYREATGYTAKGQEMMVGGGVCQPSSTLYLACLTANLEIVERKNHMYTVSYMPEGIDATVSWPNLDYVFSNNTKYPIKVSMTIENRVLTARIYGTKTDDNYVKMESVRLSTTPAGVSYQADPAVPQGTTQIVQGAHTGKKVEVYKNTYAADGTLISRTWVSTDTYRPSDKIIGYNPLDGVPEAGIAPVTDPNAPSVDLNVPPVGPSVPSAPPVTPTQPVVSPEPTLPAERPVTPPAPSVDPVTEPGVPTVEPPVTLTPPPVDISLLIPEGMPAD